jgi:uncharacterized protein
VWHDAGMRDDLDIPGDVDLDAVVRLLRASGARFAFVHGSRPEGRARPGSDVDVAAWFGSPDVDTSGVVADLPAGVDLLALDTAPLELAGRVAMSGVLLFENDPAERVAWQATTRKIYLDERPRVDRARRDFVEARSRG